MNKRLINVAAILGSLYPSRLCDLGETLPVPREPEPFNARPRWARKRRMNFEKIVTFLPAYDRRNTNPAKNYGIHGVELHMVLKGSLGAVQFVLYTNWQLPEVAKQLQGVDSSSFHEPLPADLSYHWRTPRHEDQGPAACHLLDGANCYYDGSALNANRIYEVLLREGSDGVWRELEKYYHDVAGMK